MAQASSHAVLLPVALATPAAHRSAAVHLGRQHQGRRERGTNRMPISAALFSIGRRPPFGRGRYAGRCGAISRQRPSGRRAERCDTTLKPDRRAVLSGAPLPPDARTGAARKCGANARCDGRQRQPMSSRRLEAPSPSIPWRAPVGIGWHSVKRTGGGSGIRTRDTVSGIHTFQACAFNHSATPPAPNRHRWRCPAEPGFYSRDQSVSRRGDGSFRTDFDAATGARRRYWLDSPSCPKCPARHRR